MATDLRDPQEKQHSLNPGDEHAKYLADVASGLAQLEEYANDPNNHDNAVQSPLARETSRDGHKQATSPSANIDKTRELEKNSPWKNNYQGGFSDTKKSPLTFKAMVSKKGPIGLIILLLGGGGIGVGTLLSPSLVLVELKTLFTNDLSDSSSAVKIKSNALMGNKIGSKVAKAACSTAGILCKMNTMSDDEVRNFKDKGFKVNSEKIAGDRNVVNAISMPEENVKITSPDEAKAALNDPKIASLFQRVYNPATQFVRGTFFSGVLAKIGLSKVAKVVGDTKEKVRESYRRTVGADVNTGEGGRFSSLTEKAKGVSEKLNKAGALEIPCMGYNIARVTLAGIQTAKMLGYAGIAMAFFIGADRIIAGDSTPAEAEQLGNQVSQPDNRKEVDGKPNPDYGKTATDAEGFKLIAYGDTGALPGYAMNYLLAGSGALIALNSIINKVQSFPGGKQTVKTICKAARAGGMAACLGGVAVLICGAMALVGAPIIGHFLGQAISGIISAASKIDFDDTTVGPKVGQAIFLGASFIMYHMWQSYGMKPSNKKDISDYAVATAQVRQNDIAIAKYDARSEPLNIYNQYSFLGSIATNLHLSGFSSSSLATNMMNIMGMIPTAFASATTAGATGMFQPQQPYNPDRYNICPEDAAEPLKSIGVDPDASCLPRGTLSNAELAMDPNVATHYMIDNGHVDPMSGDPKSDDYKKYIEFCAQERTDPMGYVSQEIEEGGFDDEDWASGKKCTDENDMMHAFRVYNIVKPVNDGMGTRQTSAAAYDDFNPSDIASILQAQGAM